MNKIYTLLTIILVFTYSNKMNAQIICDSTGNLIIYSNYNGGELTINVDENIPNLKIGLESYCFEHVTITGAYAGNVTGVWWTGYNSMNNNCSTPVPFAPTITGAVNATVDSITPMATATYNDPDGWPTMIMCYQCIFNPGALNNSPAQVVHFFQTYLGGTFRYHFTQYGCWTGTYNVSEGGNCCLVQGGTVSVNDVDNSDELFISPNPTTGAIGIRNYELGIRNVLIYDVMGQLVFQSNIQNSKSEINISSFDNGIYFVRLMDGDGNMVYSEKVIKE